MIPFIRKQKILEELEVKEIVYFEELASKLSSISESTIRRDLKSLADEQQIVLLRGGGVKLNKGAFDMPVEKKILINICEKERIARTASKLIKEGEVVYIDSGTTVNNMIKYIKNMNITIVTSNTQSVNELADAQAKCIFVGGEIRGNLASVVGPITDNILRNMYFDKSFIGANAYSLEAGITTPDPREASKKTIVKNNSKETYVLVDSAKADKINFSSAFMMHECVVITDVLNDTLIEGGRYIIAD